MSDALREALYRAGLEQLRQDRDVRELEGKMAALDAALTDLEMVTAPRRATMRHATKETKH